MLLPAGFQLERARACLPIPVTSTTDDIKEFISLSSAREEAERKEREEALARDEAQVAEIKAAQARTADAQAHRSLQRITRWAFAAVAAVILIAGGTVGIFAVRTRHDNWRGKKLRLTHAQANILG